MIIIDKFREMIDRRKRNFIKEEALKLKTKKRKKEIKSNKSSLNEMMEKFFLDHNGILHKKDAHGIRADSLPGLFKRPFGINIQSDPKDIKSPRDSSKEKKSKSMYRSVKGSKNRIPEYFRKYVQSPQEVEMDESDMKLQESVRLITSQGEKIGKSDNDGFQTDRKMSRREYNQSFDKISTYL